MCIPETSDESLVPRKARSSMRSHVIVLAEQVIGTTDVRYVERLCENAGPLESCYDLGVKCGGMA